MYIHCNYINRLHYSISMQVSGISDKSGVYRQNNRTSTKDSKSYCNRYLFLFLVADTFRSNTGVGKNNGKIRYTSYQERCVPYLEVQTLIVV